MGIINDNLNVLYVGVAAAMYFRPEYALFDSRAATMLLSFIIITAWKIFYQLALYPAFLTPIKHIQTPTVHKSIHSREYCDSLITPGPNLVER